MLVRSHRGNETVARLCLSGVLLMANNHDLGCAECMVTHIPRYNRDDLPDFVVAPDDQLQLFGALITPDDLLLTEPEFARHLVDVGPAAELRQPGRLRVRFPGNRPRRPLLLRTLCALPGAGSQFRCLKADEDSRTQSEPRTASGCGAPATTASSGRAAKGTCVAFRTPLA